MSSSAELKSYSLAVTHMGFTIFRLYHNEVYITGKFRVTVQHKAYRVYGTYGKKETFSATMNNKMICNEFSMVC